MIKINAMVRLGDIHYGANRMTIN